MTPRLLSAPEPVYPSNSAERESRWWRVELNLHAAGGRQVSAGSTGCERFMDEAGSMRWREGRGEMCV